MKIKRPWVVIRNGREIVSRHKTESIAVEALPTLGKVFATKSLEVAHVLHGHDRTKTKKRSNNDGL